MKRKKLIAFAVTVTIFATSVLVLNKMSDNNSEEIIYSTENYRITNLSDSKPYAIFGEDTPMLMTKCEEEGTHQLTVDGFGADRMALKLVLDTKTGLVEVSDANGNIVSSKTLNEQEMARWFGVDPLAEKYSAVSPYNFCLNNPIRMVDPNGEDVYMYFAVTGHNNGADDRMFMTSMMTRIFDLLENPNFGKGDIAVWNFISDMSDMENIVHNNVEKYSKYYGKTKEFGIWSHRDTDGPIGNTKVSEALRRAEGSYQLSMSAWSNINFNWAEGASAIFYGCQTAVGGATSFARNLSLNNNMIDVNVLGQNSYSYPSNVANARRFNEEMINGNFKYPTYMVGSRLIIGRLINNSIPMNGYKNGKFNGTYKIGINRL